MIRWSFIFALWCSLAQAEVWYAHSDHLGSASAVTDASGAVSQMETYTPFGEILTPHLSSSPQRGEERGEGATPYLYTGQELDRATELYYYGARYYDSVLVRFVSRDPVLSEAPYAYVRNNPLIHIDPDGRELRLLNQNANYVEGAVALLQEFVGNEAKVHFTWQGSYSVASLTDVVENPSFRTRALGSLIESERVDGLFLLSEDRSLAALLQLKSQEEFIAKVVPKSEYHCAQECAAVVYMKDFDFQEGRHARREGISETGALGHELVHLLLRGLESSHPEQVRLLLDEVPANGMPDGVSMKEAIATAVANRMFPEQDPVSYYRRPGDMDFDNPFYREQFEKRVDQAITLIEGE
ncbi:MAG: RHS repeat-associated core domain-containing protein [Deltaproteobacteria bacterium]|nr:RHS repeat-associated core domain-containing protein [Deltaproteobacteria bacterium]